MRTARLHDAFAWWVDRWVDEEGPRSRYFRDVAFELLEWAAPRWAEDASVPDYLGDLARHELTYFEVASAPDALLDGAAERAPIALDRRITFSATARLRRYRYAVHRLNAELEARDLPAREPTALLAYRDADHDVRFLELTPLAAAILDRLRGAWPMIVGEPPEREAQPLGQAVVSACEALGLPVDPAVTGSTAALLGDLLERGAILGGEA